MKRRLLGLLWVLVLASFSHAEVFQSYAVWSDPKGINGEELNVQGLALVFSMQQGGNQWTYFLPYGETGCTTHRGVQGFNWDDNFGGLPSPPAWFDGDAPYKIRFEWMETIHNPVTSPYITFTVGDDGSPFRTITGNIGFTPIDHATDGPY